jgi:hypothetical protein
VAAEQSAALGSDARVVGALLLSTWNRGRSRKKAVAGPNSSLVGLRLSLFFERKGRNSGEDGGGFHLQFDRPTAVLGHGLLGDEGKAAVTGGFAVSPPAQSLASPLTAPSDLPVKARAADAWTLSLGEARLFKVKQSGNAM